VAGIVVYLTLARLLLTQLATSRVS